MNIDLKRKLTSRKFWAMLGGQITAVLTAFNAGESVIMQVGAVVGSIGIFAVYMLAEAWTDAENRRDSEDGE